MATGSVVDAAVCVRINANRNSFQATIRQNTTVAASPGFATGSTTRTSTPIRESPSIMAASSSSRGISRKKPCIIQTTKGKLKAVYTMISPSRELSRPAPRSIRNSGTMVTIGGSMRVDRIQKPIF